jgi:hypothetical protein
MLKIIIPRVIIHFLSGSSESVSFWYQEKQIIRFIDVIL